MLKEFILYPANIDISDDCLQFTSAINNIHLNSEWLKTWQHHFESHWPQITQHLRDKNSVQIMLEGESALLLLPLVLMHKSNTKKHIIFSDNVYFPSHGWTQVARFYQQSGINCTRLETVFSQLIKHWPIALPGVHRLDLDNVDATLTLGFGDASHLQQQWNCSIDLFVRDQRIGQRLWPWMLLYAAPKSYFLMDESLLKEASFLVATKKYGIQLNGFSALRHHLAEPKKNCRKTIAIIGGGIAGAGIAHVMHKRAWQVTVFDPMFAESTACQHQNHLAAAMTPFISIDDNHKSRLSRNAILRALYHWDDFPDEVILSRQGNVEINRDKGYGKDISLAVDSLALPKAWVQQLNPAQLSDILGFELAEKGIYWPMARLISPEKLLQYIYEQYAIERRATRVSRVQKQDDLWRLYDEENELLGQFEQVVIANAADCIGILEKSALLQRHNIAGQKQSTMPKIESTLHWMGGEVMHVSVENLKQVPKVALGGQGYFLPPTREGICVLGSTYRHDVRDPGLSLEGQQIIKEKMPLDLNELSDSAHLQSGWSGGRAVVQGRLPVICELDHAKGIWLAVAYGSHGLTWSSFAGDIIGASLDGEPIPLEKELLKAIALR